MRTSSVVSCVATSLGFWLSGCGSDDPNGGATTTEPVPVPMCKPVKDDIQGPCKDEASCCADADSCLSIVDAYLKSSVRQTLPGKSSPGLRQTYGPGNVGGGDCGAELCGLGDVDRFDVYDNSVAVIYSTLRGKLEDAKEILDAFVELLYSSDGDIKVPSGKPFQLLPAAYTKNGGLGDSAVDTGNNAWVGLAFAHYAAAANAPCYATVARDIMAALDETFACHDIYDGFSNRPGWGGRSIEHNIDVFSLARMLGDDDAASRAAKLVHGMYNGNVYRAGTGNSGTCDTSLNDGPKPGDAQFWNYLSDADPVADRQTSTMSFVGCKTVDEGGLWGSDQDIIGNDGAGAGTSLYGVRFSDAGYGLEWEVTAGATMAMQKYGKESEGENSLDFEKQIDLSQDSLRWLLQTYKSIPASVRGGNYEASLKKDHSAKFPGGTDTGVGWSYFRYPHLAATAWTGLLMLESHGKHGNPFAVPAQPMPEATKDLTCLPKSLHEAPEMVHFV